MAYNEESGDLNGSELFVIASQNGWHVFYQESRGELAVPQLVPASLDGSSLRFTLPSCGRGEGYPVQFAGTITETGLTGTVSDSGGRVELARTRSYWQ